MFLGFRQSSSRASKQYTLPVGRTAAMCVCSVNTCAGLCGVFGVESGRKVWGSRVAVGGCGQQRRQMRDAAGSGSGALAQHAVLTTVADAAASAHSGTHLAEHGAVILAISVLVEVEPAGEKSRSVGGQTERQAALAGPS